MAAYDWRAIKKEYITDPRATYKALAKKYGVSMRQVAGRGKAENWVDERERFFNKTTLNLIEAEGRKTIDRAERLRTAADILLDKVMQRAQDITAGEVGEIKTLTAILKDIRDIQMLRSEGDMREQEARIAKLRKEVETEKQETKVEVVFSAGEADWNE